VHVEGIPPRRAFGPAVPSELVTADDSAEPSDERLHEASLDRRQPDPGPSEAKHAVDIQLRHLVLMLPHPRVERLDPCADVGLVGRHPHPILQAVTDRRGRDPRLDEQEPGAALLL
jgi:hypothetical protein